MQRPLLTPPPASPLRSQCMQQLERRIRRAAPPPPPSLPSPPSPPLPPYAAEDADYVAERMMLQMATRGGSGGSEQRQGCSDIWAWVRGAILRKTHDL